MLRAKGVLSICPTPFKANGELDLRSLERVVSFLLEAGVNGLTVLGVMGELHALNTFERRRVIETVVATAGGAVPVWAGVRDIGLAGAIEQARRAADLGADAVLVAPLSNVDGTTQANFYQHIVEAVRIPVVIHDVPELFGANLPPTTLVQLMQAGATVLNCEDPPVGPKITATRKLVGDRIKIFSGMGGVHFLEELKRGADGVISGFSFPEILLAVYKLHSNGDCAQAARIFDRYCSLIRYEFQPSIGLALRKYSYMRRGLISSDTTRMPARSLDDLSRKEYEDVVQRVGLDLAAPLPIQI